MNCLSTRLLVISAICASFPFDAAAQAVFPARPIRFVVPFPAGGVNDIIARIVGQRASEAMGQQWIVENRAGAGGNIGTDHVAKAAPDGYTLLSGGTGSLIMNPVIAKVPYDTVRDFAPVILIARAPNIVAVHPSLPVKTVKDLVALARSRPGQLNYASGGVGSTPHLSAALFATMAGVQIVHVPYKGTAAAMTDLRAGQVQMSILGIPPALPHVRQGRLRAVGITGLARSSQLPDVPTVDAAGLHGYEVSPWYGVLAPAGTSREIVARIHGEIARIMQSPEVRQSLVLQGAEAASTTPEEYADIIRVDLKKWAKIIRDAGIRGE